MKKLMMAVVALATGFAFATDGVWTYTNALNSSKIDWQDATMWQGGAIPNGTGDTAELGGVATDLGEKIQIINIPKVAERSWNNDEKIGLALRSVTGLKNQQIRQNDGIKSLAEVFDPSGFLGPWRTERVYSGLSVSATSDTSVPQLMTGNMFELSLPNAGVKTTVGKIRGVGTMIKKGPGDLAIADAGASATTLRLAGSGTLSLGRDKSGDARPVAGAWLHLDASRTNTMTFVAGADGKTYVSRWNDCDGAAAYAEQTQAIAGSATNRPFLRLDCLNGKPVVDFGAFFGSNIDFDVYDHDVATYGETAWMNIKNQKIPKTAFVVMQEVRADHCDAVPVGNTGSALWYRFSARKDKTRYAGVPFGDTYGQFCWYRDGVSLNGRQIETGRKLSLTEWTVWAIPYEGGTYFNALMRDRTGRFGGARVAEVIAYERVLTADEIRQNVGYLKNKWLKGVSIEGEDVDLGAAIIESDGVKFDVAAGESAKIAHVENKVGATFVKTGDGELAIENVGASRPVDFDIRGGSVRLENTVPDAADDAPAANPTVWLAADADASCFDFVEENGTNFVKHWYDVRPDQRKEYALNDGGVIGTKKTFRKPWLDAEHTLNGKPIVNFGKFFSDADGNGNGQGAALRFCSKLEPREAFIVWCDDKDSGGQTWVFGSDGDGLNGFVRSIQQNRKRIVAEEYAPGSVAGGRWFVDGRLVNPMDVDLPLGEFVVIDCALEKGCPADYIGTDRPNQYARSGGCQVAEILYYDRELTDKERRDTQAYLLKKWKNLDHPDNEAVKVGSVTGSGTLEIARAVQPAFGEFGAAKLISSADIRFDASDTSTMTFDGTNVLEWRDANGHDLCARKSSYAAGTPQLISPVINGVEKKAVSLFGMNVSVEKGGYNNPKSVTGKSAAFELYKTSTGAKTTNACRDIFVVMADNDDGCGANMSHRAFVFDLDYRNAPYFYRDNSNSGKYLRPQYAADNAYKCEYWFDGTALAKPDADGKNNGATTKTITDFDYHLYSIKGVESQSMRAIGLFIDGGGMTYCGGKSICEIVAFNRALTDDERAAVNKYLQDKWQSQVASYAETVPANIVLAGGSFDVGAKTALTLAAGVPAVGKITAKSVASSDALAFDFTSRTACEQLEVEGEFVLGASGTITVGGDKPQGGEYPLVAATSLTGAANLPNWSLVNVSGSRNPMSLKIVGNTLYLVVDRVGATLIVR